MEELILTSEEIIESLTMQELRHIVSMVDKGEHAAHFYIEKWEHDFEDNVEVLGHIALLQTKRKKVEEEHRRKKEAVHSHEEDMIGAVMVVVDPQFGELHITVTEMMLDAVKVIQAAFREHIEIEGQMGATTGQIHKLIENLEPVVDASTRECPLLEVFTDIGLKYGASARKAQERLEMKSQAEGRATRVGLQRATDIVESLDAPAEFGHFGRQRLMEDTVNRSKKGEAAPILKLNTDSNDWGGSEES